MCAVPDLMKRLVFSLVLVVASHQGALAAETARPNILFAIADDWGLHAGAYGTRWVSTPAFDRIAREGVLFRNAYTPMAKCAPSRASVLTGRHLWQNEEAGNHLAAFPPKLKSWPEALMERGWHVGITGKGWAPGIANDATGKPRLITGQPFSQRKAEPATRAMSNTDYAANFVDFLDAAPKDAPWCFWYGAQEPHREYEFQSGVNKGGKKLLDVDRVPEYWPDDETVRHDMLDYALEVEHADNHLGRMIAELERRGLLDDTLVIVTSDHGMPFPRVKGYAYHDSNHVPLAIRWARGMRNPGRVVDDFVDFTDVAPTILDYAAVAWETSGMMPITGKSWRPILESTKAGRVVPERDHVLVGKERTDVGRPGNWGYPIRGIVTADYLYLHNYEPTRWPAGNPETGYLDTDGSPTKSLLLDRGRADRTDRYWQLNFGMRPADELYDLRTDRDCVRNLAPDPTHARQMAVLRQRMETTLEAQGDPRMEGRGRVFDNYRPTSGDGLYERFVRGEEVSTGWVNPTDFEKRPISPLSSPPGLVASVALAAGAAAPAGPGTTVSIRGDDFLIDGRPTYEGRTWNGHRIEGLLMNNRVVQGTFDDLNPETAPRWVYPDDGRWDAERNNGEFLAAMPVWKAHGVLAFTVNFQGGSPEGYSKGQPWENHPFNPDGSLRPAFMERMKRILDEADRLGMVPIVGYFYFGQSGRLGTDENAIRATDTLTRWLLAGGWRNLLVEINNETNPGYHPPILRVDRVHELIARVRDTRSADGRRLLVGTSFAHRVMPTVEAVRASDFVLLHGNSFASSAELVAKIRATRALDPGRVIPVVINEDDHDDFDASDGRLASAVAEHVSWGWFDWRRPGEPFDEGYQSVPVNWGLSSARKRAFHARVAEITGRTAPVQ